MWHLNSKVAQLFLLIESVHYNGGLMFTASLQWLNNVQCAALMDAPALRVGVTPNVSVEVQDAATGRTLYTGNACLGSPVPTWDESTLTCRNVVTVVPRYIYSIYFIASHFFFHISRMLSHFLDLIT